MESYGGGRVVLDKLLVQGCPINFDTSRARAYCTCSGCGWRLFGLFFSRLSFLFFFLTLSGTGLSIDRNTVLKRAVKSKRTNHGKLHLKYPCSQIVFCIYRTNSMYWDR